MCDFDWCCFLDTQYSVCAYKCNIISNKVDTTKSIAIDFNYSFCAIFLMLMNSLMLLCYIFNISQQRSTLGTIFFSISNNIYFIYRNQRNLKRIENILGRIFRHYFILFVAIFELDMRLISVVTVTDYCNICPPLMNSVYNMVGITHLVNHFQ